MKPFKWMNFEVVHDGKTMSLLAGDLIRLSDGGYIQFINKKAVGFIHSSVVRLLVPLK